MTLRWPAVLLLAALVPVLGDVQGGTSPAPRGDHRNVGGRATPEAVAESALGARGATPATETDVSDDGNPPSATRACGPRGVWVQVLGSGGPELASGRAASSYLVWIDGKARALVDLGGGAVLRLGESGAHIADLDVILLTHLHADHSADLPALVQVSSFENRTRALPVYGPPGNRFMPSTVSFVRELFNNTGGAFRHLGGTVNPMTRGAYKLQPHDVLPRSRGLGLRSRDDPEAAAFANERLAASAARVAHGESPSLAWRVRAGGKTVVFSGDTDGEGGLARLAAGADLLIAHHAVLEGAPDAGRRRHMPPSVIGRLAEEAKAKQLVLSHRTRSTFGREDETLEHIRRRYAGPTAFANDLDCFAP